MALLHKHHEALTSFNQEAISQQQTRRVGGSAFIHLEEAPAIRGGADVPESFEHLFPVVQLSHRVNEAVTAEAAEQLLDELKDGDPYKGLCT